MARSEKEAKAHLNRMLAELDKGRQTLETRRSGYPAPLPGDPSGPTLVHSKLDMKLTLSCAQVVPRDGRN